MGEEPLHSSLLRGFGAQLEAVTGAVVEKPKLVQKLQGSG